MTNQNKILLALTVIAVATIGMFAKQVINNLPQNTESNQTPKNKLEALISSDDYARGNPIAPENKTIIEFGDMECPYCASIDPQVTALVTAFPNAKIVWKDCPIPSHPNAANAAAAARCAGQQGKFWEYRDALLTFSNNLNSEIYYSTASSLNLDTEKFSSCLNNNEEGAKINRSLSECVNAGVTELPAFYINNKLISGTDIVGQLTTELKSK